MTIRAACVLVRVFAAEICKSITATWNQFGYRVIDIIYSGVANWISSGATLVHFIAYFHLTLSMLHTRYHIKVLVLQTFIFRCFRTVKGTSPAFCEQLSLITVYEAFFQHKLTWHGNMYTSGERGCEPCSRVEMCHRSGGICCLHL
jgi:hypothetical protein